MTSLAISDVDLRKRLEDLADEVMRLRSDRDKWRHRCDELSEERTLWKERADAAQTALAILEGSSRRLLDVTSSTPESAGARGALIFALAEVSRSLSAKEGER